ncbi:MAG TPA: hypothetical protein VGL81_31700 [Polyangiaceae bacterium]|jgi:hypothetical protein
MKLAALWIVRDPSPQSGLVDVVFEMDVPRLGNYVLGSGPGTWEREHHTVFSEKDEAVAEGIRRLVRIRPEREGWINEEAYREFGFGAPGGGR